MKPEKGYYSVIQYCPDLARFEAANIGVLLFCPQSGFLKALTSGNNRRIIKFFGSAGHDWKRINTVKRALQDRLPRIIIPFGLWKTSSSSLPPEPTSFRSRARFQ
jgi:hypothetical protein